MQQPMQASMSSMQPMGAQKLPQSANTYQPQGLNLTMNPTPTPAGPPNLNFSNIGAVPKSGGTGPGQMGPGPMGMSQPVPQSNMPISMGGASNAPYGGNMGSGMSAMVGAAPMGGGMNNLNMTMGNMGGMSGMGNMGGNMGSNMGGNMGMGGGFPNQQMPNNFQQPQQQQYGYGNQMQPQYGNYGGPMQQPQQQQSQQQPMYGQPVSYTQQNPGVYRPPQVPAGQQAPLQQPGRGIPPPGNKSTAFDFLN
jgi:hypothetical protein